MAGTLAGGRKAAQTNKDRHGSDFYKRIAAIGGSKGAKDGTIKGFAADRERARTAGRKGGQVSRRNRNAQYVTV
jgi:uncharacterized protein